MNRKQVLASTNEGSGDDLPLESNPATSTDVGHTEAESEGVGSGGRERGRGNGGKRRGGGRTKDKEGKGSFPT